MSNLRHKGILIKYERTMNGEDKKMSDEQIAMIHNFLLSNDLHWFWITAIRNLGHYLGTPLLFRRPLKNENPMKCLRLRGLRVGSGLLGSTSVGGGR